FHVRRMSESGLRVWLHAILKSGTAWKVISVIMPSEPRESRAARKSSTLELELQRTRWPLARTSEMAVMDWDSSPCLSELPCVPVETAPAMDWTSMLPRLGTDRPNLASS